MVVTTVWFWYGVVFILMMMVVVVMVVLGVVDLSQKTAHILSLALVVMNLGEGEVRGHHLGLGLLQLVAPVQGQVLLENCFSGEVSMTQFTSHRRLALS